MKSKPIRVSGIDNHTITQSRPRKETVSPNRPYHYLHEQEVQKDGTLRAVNTIFLTNRECPFKCVMCDLWRHTLDDPTPHGAVPDQIEYALGRLPEASVVKLYNSGNFFDGKAVPASDYDRIAGLLAGFDHVIVENHPKLIGPFIPEFSRRLKGSFEIAMGLETVHPEVLPRLNKKMTTDDFKRACDFLLSAGIDIRAFVLLNPPFLTGRAENIAWCLKTVDFAFDSGAAVCSIIPTRDGNGIMEQLGEQGDFVPPGLSALEEVFDQAITRGRGRVFCDLWDLERFSDCPHCLEARKSRLHAMNTAQKRLPAVECSCRKHSVSS